MKALVLICMEKITNKQLWERETNDRQTLLLMKVKGGRTMTESQSQPQTAGTHILLVWITLRPG